MAGENPLPRSGMSAQSPGWADAAGTVKWFTYKAGKKETQQHANARALLAAMDYKNRWIEQYNQDFPNAPSVSHAADNAWLSSWRKTPTSNIKIAGDDSNWSVPKGKKKAAPINEGTYKIQLPKAAATDSEEKKKLIDLRNQYSIANQAVTELKKQQKEGTAPTPEKHKAKGIGGFINKEIWHPFTKGYAYSAGRFLGRDVVGKGLDLLGRGGQGWQNELTYSQTHPRMIPPEMMRGKDKKVLAKKGASQQEIDAAFEKYKQTYAAAPGPKKTGFFGDPEALRQWKRGVQGKERHDYTSEVLLPTLAQRYPALRPNKNDAWYQKTWKAAPGVAGGLVAGSIGDPTMVVHPGITTNVGKVLKTLGKGAEEGTLAAKAASVSSTLADRFAEEDRVAEMIKARKAGDKTIKLRDIQKANAALDATRAKTAASITSELLQEGFTPHEIASLGLHQSVAARAYNVANTANTAISARKYAEKLLQDVKFGNRKLDPNLITTHVSRFEEALKKDSRVKSAVEDLADAKIAGKRAAQGPLSTGGQAREDILREAQAQIIQPQSEELRKILTEASQRRFNIKGLENIPGLNGALRGAYMPFQLAGSGPSSIPEFQKTLRALHIPYEFTGKGLRGTGLGEDFLKKFSMGAHFPGEAERVRQMTESAGIADAADNSRRIDRIFKGFSKDQREEILRARDEGRFLDNPAMEKARIEAAGMSDEIFQKLKDAGIYTDKDYAQNYVHHQYTHGKPEDIKSYKAARKAAIKRGEQGPTLADAAKFGDKRSERFKPIDTIDGMLKSQYRDASRKLTRVNYRLGTISRYGVLTDNTEMAARQGLVAIEDSKLTPLLRNKAKLAGGQWYLPKEIKNSWDSMDALMGALGEPAGKMQRFSDQVMHIFKSQATIYNPANWVNNTLGDITMNYIDGVRDPRRYSQALGMLRLSKEEAPRTINLGGEAIDANTLLHDFKHSSPSGGFIRTEGGKISDHKFFRGLTNGYETREETSRLAHFLSSINEEMYALKQEGAPAEKVYQYAVERAARRVAKYNIDYTAITPFERSLRRNFIPFYTYTRKAAPLMAESMATHPGRFTQMSRYQGALGQLLQAGTSPKEWQPIDVPEYAQQAGMFRLDSSDQPYYLRNTTPPFILNRLFGGLGSPTDPIKNVGNMMGPFIKMPIEAMYRRSLFSGQPITNWGNWLIGQSPWAAQGARMTGNPLSVGQTKTPAPSTAQTILNALGVPVSRLTYNQQQQKVHRDIAKLGFDTKTRKDINKALAPFTIKPVHGKSGKYWTIVYGADEKGKGGKVVEEGRYRDWNQAVQEAWRRRNDPNVTSSGHSPNYKKPTIPEGYKYKMLGGKLQLVGPGPTG